MFTRNLKKPRIKVTGHVEGRVLIERCEHPSKDCSVDCLIVAEEGVYVVPPSDYMRVQHEGMSENIICTLISR